MLDCLCNTLVQEASFASFGPIDLNTLTPTNTMMCTFTQVLQKVRRPFCDRPSKGGRIQLVATVLLLLVAGDLLLPQRAYASSAPRVGSSLVPDGVYRLKNHNTHTGTQPPNYGMRLDKLFGNYAVVSFDFEHPSSNVLMTVNGTVITITGTVYGGRDNGSAYDTANAGLWELNFTYNTVTTVGGDDDLTVTLANGGSNTGTIKALFSTSHFSNGQVFNLGDYSDGVQYFRLGNEDNDLGHRGFNGISGWGWLEHGKAGSPLTHVDASDWIFTAHKLIDLELLKTVDVASPTVGSTVTYTLTLTNNGTNAATAATGVVVTDVLPTGLAFVSATASTGTYTSSTGTWSVASLGDGASATLTLKATVTGLASIENCAEVTDADQEDYDSTPSSGNKGGQDDDDCRTITPIAPPAGEVCYLVADNDGRNNSADEFTFVNKLTGVESVIGGLGTFAVEAIAYSPWASTLYATNQNGATGEFGTINLTTGAFTKIGNVGSGTGALGTITFSDIDGLAFDPFSGKLYGTVRRTNEDLLIQIDPATGDAVNNAFGSGVDYLVVAPLLGLDDLDDIAFDPTNGTLYTVINEDGTGSRLATINAATGATTDVVALDVQNVEGLTFDTDGTILGVRGDADTYLVEIDPTTGQTTTRATLGAGDNRDYEAASCITNAPNTISGTVFLDTDGDGVLDAGEAGQAGVTVKLYRDTNNNNLVDAGDVFISALDTGLNGTYTFSVLSTGDFALEIDTADLPVGSLLTTDNAEEASFSGFGQSDPNNNFGFRNCTVVTLQDLIDAGSKVNTGGSTATLVVPANACPVEVSFSSYALPGGFIEPFDQQVLEDNVTNTYGPGTYTLTVDLPQGCGWQTDLYVGPVIVTPPHTGVLIDADFLEGTACNPGTVGDLVWRDDDGDQVKDAAEPGLAGVTLTLTRPGTDGTCATGDDVAVGTKVTDANGAYLFTGLSYGGAGGSQGRYCVDVTGGVPAGYTLTTGNDPLALTLTNAAKDFLTADFGYKPPVTNGSIGDRVWADLDGDGVQDAGETGLNGVVIRLYGGVCGPTGTALATQTTSGDGGYDFTGLAAGSYCVDVDQSTVPAGYVLTFNVDPLTVNLSTNEDYNAGDFGYKPPVAGEADLSVTKDVNNTTPDVNEQVTFTITLRNDGPDAATNVKVRDVMPFGLTFISASTSAGTYDPATGFWSFNTFANGASATLTIIAQVQPVVNGYVVENVAEVVFVDQQDPDSTPANGIPTEDDQDNAVLYINVIGGDKNGTADVGVTKEVDEPAPALNEVVTLTITATNLGPDDATGVIVRDQLPYGFVFVSATPSQGTYEPANGFWTLGSLPVGSVATLQMQAQVIVVNTLENIAQVISLNQNDPNPANDQDNALVTARSNGGDVTRPECADAGTINALAFDPVNGVIYAGTEEGVVHVSTDNGENWPPFLDTAGDAPVRDVVVTGTGTAYAGTLGDGVYRSTDGGTTWTGIGPAGALVDDLDLSNAGLLYAAMGGKVQVWNGSTWSEVGAGSNPFTGKQVKAVVVEETGGAVFASAPGAGVGTFRFNGSTWSGTATGLPSTVNTLAYTASGQVLAGTNNDGIFRFDGSAWVRFGTGLDSEPIETIEIGIGGQILVGTRQRGFYEYDSVPNAFVSKSFANLGVYTVRAVTVNDAGQYFLGSAGSGIYRSADPNADGVIDFWHQVSSFLAHAVIQDLVVAPNGDLFAASYGYGVLYSNDGGQCWTRLNRGLENLWTYALERASNGWLYLGIWADGLGGVWRSKDNGRNWEFLDLGNRQIISLAIDPTNDNVLYAGANLAGEGSIFKSTDGGETWTQLGGFTQPAWGLTIDPATPTTLAVSTLGNGVYRSTDGGVSWTQIGSPTNGLAEPNVFEVVYAPTGTAFAGTLFAGTADGVYSYNGSTWGLFGTGSDGFDIRTLTFVGSTIYAGTWNAGVLQYNSATGVWEDLGLGDLPVVAFAVHPQTQALLIGTSGHGLFRLEGITIPTATEDDDRPADVPAAFQLGQNYPNPFNPATTITFSMSTTAPARLAVYDLLGREVRTLVEGVVAAGMHSLVFEAGDLPSGTYLYRLSTPQGSFTRTLTLLK
jgi:uncharacterized repeat protein (TIGR01451 family)